MLQVSDPERLCYVTQTTLSMDDCQEIIDALHRRFPMIRGPRSEDICYATQNRQNALKRLCSLVDVILVIGAPNSSNTNRLREIGEKQGVPSYLIESYHDIDPSWFEGIQAVGITAGASTPDILIHEVIQHLHNLGASEVEELTVIEEHVEFKLPSDLLPFPSEKSF